MIKANDLDAGYDLVATHDATVIRGATTKILTGVRGNVPPGMVGFVCSRSGLATKHGVAVVNAPGVVDAGFTGEIEVHLTKLIDPHSYDVKKGDRIAQLVYLTLGAFHPEHTSDRGGGGFGSTGK